MPHDIVAYGEAMLRLSPDGDVRLETTRSLRVHPAGSEANVLACLARLGHRASWVSALPANAAGRRIARELAGHGVSVEHVAWTAPEERVGLYYAEEAPVPLGIATLYDRADSAFARLDPDRLPLGALDGARLLHLSGITPALGPGPREGFRRFLAAALERSVPVSLDVNYRSKLWGADEAARELTTACGVAEIVFCARADAAELWGLAGEPEAVLRGLAERFGRDARAGTLVLTLGADGAAELRGGEYARVPAYPAAGASRFGSGDAFAAGYLSAYLGGAGYLEARERLGATPLLYGAAVAALKRCIAGDIAIVTPEEVGAVLAGGAARFR